MAQSSQSVYDQMMEVQRGMNPLLDNQAGAPEYFRKGINEAYNYNLPAIKNAAALEAGAYNIPGKLMSQYDQEYGGKTGLGSMARMNSILKNIGQQFGMSNAAWNLVDQNKMRMDEVVKGITDQYMGNLDAYKTKWGMLSPLWQTLYGEEQANKRAWANRPTTPSPITPFDKEAYPEKPGGNNNVSKGTMDAIGNAIKGKPVNIGTQYIDNYGGLRKSPYGNTGYSPGGSTGLGIGNMGNGSKVDLGWLFNEKVK